MEYIYIYIVCVYVCVLSFCCLGVLVNGICLTEVSKQASFSLVYQKGHS